MFGVQLFNLLRSEPEYDYCSYYQNLNLNSNCKIRNSDCLKQQRKRCAYLRQVCKHVIESYLHQG